LAWAVFSAGCGEPEPPVGAASFAIDACDETRLCYADADADGYGVAPGVEACAASACPDGMTASAGDCDDQDPAVHPRNLERANNGIDDDCDGLVDEARFLNPPYWFTNETTAAGARAVVQLGQESELRLARQGGELYGKIAYRPLAAASSPPLVTGFLRAELGDADDADDVAYAVFRLQGLAPLTAYEMRIDFYRRAPAGPSGLFRYERIAPGRPCEGGSDAPAPCSNSDLHHFVTRPAGADAAVGAARAELVARALYEVENPIVGRNDHEFYAAAAESVLRDLDPRAQTDAAALRSWFAAYPGALLDPAGGPRLDDLRPGDWLAVDGGARGPRTQVFLAYDAAARRYWFAEGDAVTPSPFGPFAGAPRVAARDRCGNEAPAPAAPPAAPCPAGARRVRLAGAIDARMLD
jgi:hypothetical protein